MSWDAFWEDLHNKIVTNRREMSTKTQTKDQILFVRLKIGLNLNSTDLMNGRLSMKTVFEDIPVTSVRGFDTC